MRVISANVNGIRAAARRGGLDWLAERRPDILCLQEVRARPDQAAAVLADSPFADWQCTLADSGRRPGHAGVAVLTPAGHLTHSPLPADEFAGQGRWAAVQAEHSGGPVFVASVYVPTGDAGDPVAQGEKERFLTALGDWMAAHGDVPALVCGDLNVGHTENDIKNWKGNRGKSGFLESERAHLTRWYDPHGGLGWVDLGRRFGGDGPGPYTWWSWRGKAFDNDTGWRIDCVLASPVLAPRVTGVTVGRAQSYAQRWSDHAAVVVDVV